MRIFLLLGLLITSPLCWSSLSNQLKDHVSPYLAMHANDPVAWQDWSQDILALAKRTNKPLFISSGYFACHWCHVMQRETYQVPAVAALLNQYFIPVKIDRELLPALDEHLIDFVNRTKGSAGWPLNVFLTPDGHMFYGLTFMSGKPFETLLTRIQGLWVDKRSELLKLAQSASLDLAAEKQIPLYNGKMDAEALQSRLMYSVIQSSDEIEGGFGQQSRFPMSPQWQVIIELLSKKDNSDVRERALLTLKQMMSQGLRDQLGGGFFRYTVDPNWQIPHFEKMLYNQALQAQLFLTAAQVFKNTLYLDVAKHTLDFVLKEMNTPDGGYIASLSAVDAQGIEGAGYVWSKEQLNTALTPSDLAFAQTRWGLTGSPNTPDGYLPVLHTSLFEMAKSQGTTVAQLKQQEKQVTQALLQSRKPRAHPKDTKQLAAWNGLMLSALVQLQQQQQQPEPKYRAAAQALRDYLLNDLWDGQQLFRAKGAKGGVGEAALEDYAYVAKGIYDWSVLTDSDQDRQQATQLMQMAWDRFYDNGWLMSDSQPLPNMAKKAQMEDGPLPSPVALLLSLSLTLGGEDVIQQAKQAARLAYQQILAFPLYNASQISVSIRIALMDKTHVSDKK